MGALSDWNGYFGSSRKPNFGEVHTKFGHPDFEKEYYWSKSLVEFNDRLLDTLTGNFEMLNMLITGNPGVGKTSFLYSLRHKLESAPGNGHVLKIFHSNRARGFSSPQEAEECVRQEIQEAWKTLYINTGHELAYNQILSSNSSRRKTLNDLADYYLNNKSKFSKVLIFAVDDVDLLDKSEVMQIIKFVISNLEVKSVKKWFFVRPQTYDNYDSHTKEFLQGFFPDIRHLPRTPLFELAVHRIAAVTAPKQPRIPFSQLLCRYIEEITGGNLRQGLPILEKVLCDVGAPDKTSLAPEFLSNHIDRIAMRSLLSEKIIPDIHSPEFRTIAYPIAVDALSFLIYTADPAILRPCLDDALVDRHRTVMAGKKSRQRAGSDEERRSPYIRDVDFNFLLDRLQTAQLVEKNGSALRLTRLGKVVAKFASRPYFLSESKACQETDGFDFDESYYRYADVQVDHEKIAHTYLLRKF